MSRGSALGRGLSSLIPQGSADNSGLIELNITMLKPNSRQPRERFEEGALEELTHSIKQFGILQPIVARPINDGLYEIIAGERRFRAAKRAQLDVVPVIVRYTKDEQLLTEALVENIHRADLDPIEEARAYKQLIDDFSFTHDVLADRLGKSRSAITNALRLLNLDPGVTDLISTGSLSAGHGRALSVLTEDIQQAIATRIIEEGLSVRRTEEIVQNHISKSRPTTTNRKSSDGYISELEDQLEAVIGSRVKITGTSKRGKIQISFSSAEDLSRIIEIFEGL